MQIISYIPISKLKPHPDNPRLIKDEAFRILCESIKANKDYFETRPILCNKDMVVFAGNMRLRAAQHLEWLEVPCAIMDIDEDRQRELMIRDNVSNGEYDPQLLSAHFGTDELKKWGVDMSQFGVFGNDEVPENLTGSEKKDLKPTIKITFESTEQLEEVKPIIEQMLQAWPKATLSVSAGEL